MASPLEMYSEYVLVITLCSAKMVKLVRKWPMADCYFKLWYMGLYYVSDITYGD